MTRFLGMQDVKAKLKPLRPKTPREIDVSLKVEPRSRRCGILGTAFDYLLRFELQRRAHHAIDTRWVAELAAELLWRKTSSGEGGWDLLRVVPDPKDYQPPQEVGRRAHAVLENAKAALAGYLKTEAPSSTQRAELAAHAIRLAKLDEVFRSLRFLDPKFEASEPDDVADLLAMLAIVPFDALLHKRIMLLNPTFGESSQLVGGADADLIAGDLLVDFKVTKKPQMSSDDLDQLLGYYLLARNHRCLDPTFPEIMRAAFYFCRHAYLWVQNVAIWTAHPEFVETEGWFFRRAKEVFKTSD